MKSHKKIFIFLFIFFLNGCTSQTEYSNEILVGAAMSLLDVSFELGRAFESANPGVSVNFTHAGSGALQSQIEEGAPIDVFISAALTQMDNLYNQGLIIESRNLITNTVVLIVPIDSDLYINTFTDLSNEDVRMVAVGDPEFVPIGQFAQQIFEYLEIEDLQTVLASDVRQVLTWVEAGEVDAGIVFLTDAITSDLIRIVEIADSSMHSPSINPVGIVSTTNNLTQSEAFVDFLFTSQAAEIFENFGFNIY